MKLIKNIIYLLVEAIYLWKKVNECKNENRIVMCSYWTCAKVPSIHFLKIRD